MLDLAIPKPAAQINHRESLLLVGSCFTENIGGMLAGLKFNAVSNPTGILFDPDSVGRHFNDFVHQRAYRQEDLAQHDGVWLSWNHHGRFSNADSSKAAGEINDAVQVGSVALRQARWCIVTLGSSFAYRLKEADARVANCHRVPQTQFVKERMTADETFFCLKASMGAARRVNPNLNFILTVSPVRHSRDGLVENNLSKAGLIEAVHALVEAFPFAHYFPAYELVIDVLRDYRFYDVDLVHPNYAATRFVFEKFCETWLDGETSTLVEEIKPIVNALRHKPQHPDTEAHRLFLERLHAQTKALSVKTPWCDWSRELRYFGGDDAPIVPHDMRG